jgi:hypothetical protein
MLGVRTYGKEIVFVLTFCRGGDLCDEGNEPRKLIRRREGRKYEAVRCAVVKRRIRTTANTVVKRKR